MKPLNFTNFHRPMSLGESLRYPTVWTFIIATGGALLAALGGLIAIVVAAVTLSILETVIIGMLCVVFAVGLTAAAWYSYTQLPQHGDIVRFAQDNDMTYSTQQDSTRRPGFFFENVENSFFSDILTSPAHDMSEIGTFTYLIQHKGQTHAKRRGYMRIKLPRRLPHIILDSKHDDAFGVSLYLNGLQGEHIQLEGDFNRYFRLIAPHGYTTDALYIFTPDIMQLLIDYASNYDCEIVDDNFYIHSETVFKLGSQAELEKLFAIIEQLQPKLDRRTDYYADSRVEGSRQANVVAPEGARVTRKFPVIITVVVIVVVVLFQVLQAILDTVAP